MKKLIAIGAALALAVSVAFVATGNDNAVACNKAAKTAASKDACNATAKTASTGCDKSAATKTASTRKCSKSAAAKTASTRCGKPAAAASECCPGGKAVAARYCRDEKRKARAEHAAALREITDDLPYRENRRLVLTGEMECGYCNYKATGKCAPLLKTADGKVYPLVHDATVDRMHDIHASQYEVSTRVKKTSGVKYLEVQVFKAL